jgi:hypothetical protein
MALEIKAAEAPSQQGTPPAAEVSPAVTMDMHGGVAATATETSAPTQPRKWAGKFESPEALETAYAEAQKLIGQRRIDSPESLAEKAGIKLEELTSTYLADGKLPPAALEALERAGIGKAFAERIVQGEAARVQQAQSAVERVVQQVTEIAGGQVQRDTVLNWAAANMPKAEIESMNTRLNDPAQAVSAIRELMFMHQQAVGAGKARPLVSGIAPVAEAPGFTSTDQVVAAMAQARRQGYIDESLRRRIANTPEHIMQGRNR